MHLIDTLTLKLVEFSEEKVPYGQYAVVSHRWTDDEITFKEYRKGLKRGSIGYSKVVKSCELAQSRGRTYLWIDTCCIDKRSSAELSEAINSMYRWYQRSAECYALLHDVPTGFGNDRHSTMNAIGQSNWFTRGWTLQELLAPTSILFFDQAWNFIGNRQDDDIASCISQVTKIQLYDLNSFSQYRCSIARKFSWMSNRRTSRPEDLAYSLLGLFDVQMPLLYGEGAQKAFMRLQLEIIRKTDDKSIFAWHWPRSDELAYNWRGLLAPTPAPFEACGDVVVDEENFENKYPYEMTNQGLSLRSNAELVTGETSEKYIIDLDCTTLVGEVFRTRQRCYLVLEPSAPNGRMFRRRHFASTEVGRSLEEKYPKERRRDAGTMHFFVRQAGL